MAIVRKNRFEDDFIDVPKPTDTSNYEEDRLEDPEWKMAKLKIPPNSSPTFIEGMYYIVVLGKIDKAGEKIEAVSAPNPPFINDDSIG